MLEHMDHSSQRVNEMLEGAYDANIPKLSTYQMYDFLEDDDLEDIDPSSYEFELTPKAHSSALFKMVSLLVTLVILGALLVLQLSPEAIIPIALSEAKFSSTTIQVIVSDPNYNVVSLEGSYPWVIAEPYKEQSIQIKSITTGEGSVDISQFGLPSGYEVVWIIDGITYSGEVTTFVLPKIGVIDASVIVTSNYSLTVYASEFQIAAKYVRREIRSLTDEDRDKFFKALQTMYSTNDEEGKSKYGSKFRSMEYLLAKQLHDSETTDCDHWNNGLGALAKNAALLLEAEQSLQAIDPTISMPYWDFSKYSNSDSLRKSKVFDKDWFGEADPSNPSRRIGDGSVWSDVIFPYGNSFKDWDIKKTGSLNPYINSYGVLRSPWNANSSPYISRSSSLYGAISSSSLPGCSQLQTCFQTETLSAVHECANSLAHNPIASMLGGAWGGETVLTSNSNLDFLRQSTKLTLFKNLWRLGYTRCPTTCTVDQPCTCSVPEEYIKEYGAYEILKRANVLNVLDDSIVSSLDQDDQFYTDLLTALQSPGVVGDILTSAASYDPIFWPLQGANDRFLSYKRFMASLGFTTLKTKWDKTSMYTDKTVLSGRSDWSQVEGVEDLTLPNYDSTATCEGQSADDVTNFSNFLNQGETYTNQELLEFINPLNDKLPYVYDSYDYSYCVEQGFDLTLPKNT